MVSNQIQYVTDAFDAFEAATGMNVCVHCYNGRGPFQGDLALHSTPFCIAQKQIDVNACKRDDCCEIHEYVSPATHHFEKVCHGDVHEIVFPIFERSCFQAYLYVGQFLREARRGIDVPVLSQDEIDQIIDLGKMLRGFVADTIRRANENLIESSDRLHRIRLFIREHLQNNPGIADVARSLGLSESRTSHLIKELSGTTFQKLKDEERLGLTKELLVSTNASITWISHRCGFADPNYFSRHFRKAVGSTPTAYREAHSAHTNV